MAPTHGTGQVGIALVAALLAATALAGCLAAGQGSVGGDEPRPNIGISTGVLAGDDFLQFNMTVQVRGRAVQDATLDVFLPDLRRPDRTLGWELLGDPAAVSHCVVHVDHMGCFWDGLDVGEDPQITLRGDACCLCGPSGVRFVVDAREDHFEGDNLREESFPGPGCDGAVAMTLPLTVVPRGDALEVTVRNPEEDLASALGVELWGNLFAPVPHDWLLEGEGAKDCLVDDQGDLWCGIGTIRSLDSWSLTVRAGPGHPCGSGTTIPFRLTSDNDPKGSEASGTLRAPPCDPLALASDVSLEAGLTRTGDDVTAAITLANRGPGEARSLAVWASLPDPGRDWMVLAPECDRLGRHTLRCDVDAIGAGESRTLVATLNAEGLCGEPALGVVFASAANDVNSPVDEAGVLLDLPACGPGGNATLETHHDAFHESSPGAEFGVIRLTWWNVGDAPVEDLTVRSLMPSVGGRWLIFGEDAADCDLTFHDLNCDLGELAPGTYRTVSLKAYTHDMDCAHHVSIVQHAWQPGERRTTEATLVPPPHKVPPSEGDHEHGHPTG